MIVKRLEASVLGRRVHVGQQLVRIAEPGDFVSRHHAHRTSVRRSIIFKRPAASRRSIGSIAARVYAAHNG